MYCERIYPKSLISLWGIYLPMKRHNCLWWFFFSKAHENCVSLYLRRKPITISIWLVAQQIVSTKMSWVKSTSYVVRSLIKFVLAWNHVAWTYFLIGVGVSQPDSLVQRLDLLCRAGCCLRNESLPVSCCPLHPTLGDMAATNPQPTDELCYLQPPCLAGCCHQCTNTGTQQLLGLCSGDHSGDVGFRLCSSAMETWPLVLSQCCKLGVSRAAPRWQGDRGYSLHPVI